MRVLLDSDIIIECLKGNPSVVQKLKELSHGSNVVSYTPISTAEIYAGIRKNELAKVKYFFDNLNLVPLGDDIGQKAGSYLQEFSKSHNVEIADALIAASAFVTKSNLFTHNKKHYPMSDIELF